MRTGDNSRVNALLQRDLEEASRPFNDLELQIFALTSSILVIAVFAAVIFARTVSQPLRVLADGAGRVERGDYVTPIVVQQQDEIGHLATAFNQMQSAIATREEEIRFQATHDALTGLPNRTLFLDRLSYAIIGARRNGPAVGMIMMDIDRFKEINDTLGHQFGDQLLIEIGRRLEHTLRRATRSRASAATSSRSCSRRRRSSTPRRSRRASRARSRRRSCSATSRSTSTRASASRSIRRTPMTPAR